MWLVRWRMREPRPLARACMRFLAGPSSTMIVATLSSSTSAPRLFSAFATAESSTFLMRCAAFLSLNCRRFVACPTPRPRTWSATRRAFCAEMRAPRRMALASIVISLLLRLGGLLVGRMTLERARHGELAELVPDHVLVDEHRHVLAAVVDRERQTDHFRNDHRAARPRLDPALGPRRDPSDLHPPHRVRCRLQLANNTTLSCP